MAKIRTDHWLITNIVEKNSRVLDIGSGNGHHVNLLEKSGYKVEGVDKSTAMINSAKKKYPSCKFN